MQSGELFISYAADDPDWPANKVQDIALRLKSAGVEVHLDALHRQAMGRRLSVEEWIDWMEARLQTAKVVLCLCSSRYHTGVERKEEVPTGRGVAFESFQIIHRLYNAKQNNKGWVWLAFPAQADHEAIRPRRLDGRCPEYPLDQGDTELCNDLIGLLARSGRQTQAERLGSPKQTDLDESSAIELVQRGAIHRQHLDHARDLLIKAPALWTALTADDFGGLTVVRSSPAAFVAWLDTADEKSSKRAMHAISRSLRTVPANADMRLASELAAAALFVLAACRQVSALASDPKHLIDVPAMDHAMLYCAVVAVVLAGGKLDLMPSEHAGVPCPRFSFELLPAASAHPTGAVLRALYSACFKDAAAVRHSLKEDLTEQELDQLEARLETIREVERSTLVLYLPKEFPDGALLDLRHTLNLDVPVFRQVAEAVLPRTAGMRPTQLVAAIQEFWLQVVAIPRDIAPGAKLAAVTGPSDTSATVAPDLTPVFSALQQLVQLCQTLADRDQAQQIEKKATELATQIKTGDADKKGWIRQTLEDIKSSADALEGGQNLAAAAGNLALIVARHIG